MIPRFGKPPEAGQKYTRRPGAYAILLRGSDMLVTYQGAPHDEFQLPGGGIDAGESPLVALHREVFEETGLSIAVGAPCLVNEFHDPDSGYHQIDLFFRCTVQQHSNRPTSWTDTENIVTDRRWLTRDALATTPHKPDSLAQVAFGGDGITYDPLEVLVN